MNCKNCKFWYFEDERSDNETGKVGTCDNDYKPKFIILSSFGCRDDGKNDILFPANFGCKHFKSKQPYTPKHKF